MHALRVNIATPVTAGVRLPILDELRGLALVLVLCHHGGGVLGLPNWLHGELGVDVFLIVSGFTLAFTAVDQPAGDFLKRRFFRIFPAYWLAIGLFLWLHHHFFRVDYSAANIGLHVAGLHAFGPDVFFGAINDSFWFISMIVAAYAVFLALRRHLDNFSLIVAAGGLLTTVACVAYLENAHYGGLIHVGLRIPDFFIGLIAGRLLAAGTIEIRFNFFLGLGLLCFLYLIFIRKIHFTYPVPALGIIATWIAVHGLLGRAAVGRWVLGAVAGLGVISYEVYLFHQPLIREYNLLFQRVAFGNPAPAFGQLLTGMGVALILTVGLSLAVHAVTNRLFKRTLR